jgi:hypothetical protein
MTIKLSPAQEASHELETGQSGAAREYDVA